MSLQDIYRQTILDHAREPRNNRAVDPADRRAEAFNALCGDRLDVTLALKGQTIDKIGVRVRGCAICQASASLMSELVKGGSLVEAVGYERDLRQALCEDAEPPPALKTLEPLLALRGQRPRHRCVLLPWEALCACAAAAP